MSQEEKQAENPPTPPAAPKKRVPFSPEDIAKYPELRGDFKALMRELDEPSAPPPKKRVPFSP